MTRQAARQCHVDSDVSELVASGTMGADGIRDKAAPFTAVRADADVVEVQLETGGAWYGLVELDGVPVDEVAAAARKFGRRWLKRLGEDLDAVYDAAGRTLGASVDVVLTDAAGRRLARTLDCTIAKRKAAWRFNNAPS